VIRRGIAVHDSRIAFRGTTLLNVARLPHRGAARSANRQAIEARRTFRAHGYYLLGESLPDFPA
jgi:hypothetical protein